MIDGGGIDGNNGFTVATRGNDLHLVGPTAPLIPGYIGCVVVPPDGSCHRARAMPDPLAQQEPDS